MRFQSGCNKIVLKLRVVQFWSEIILEILKSNSRGALVGLQKNHAYDFRPNCIPLGSITITHVDVYMYIVGVSHRRFTG